MAQQTTIELIDDIDGSEAEETIEFGLDGAMFEIDLSGDNADELRDALATYVEHGRRIGRKRAGGRAAAGGRPAGTSSQSAGSRQENQAIRAWARDNGYEISERGRIPSNVTEAYHSSK